MGQWQVSKTLGHQGNEKSFVLAPKKKNTVGCWENRCSGGRESLRWTENKWLMMEVQLYDSHQVFQDSIKHRDLGGDHWPHFAPIYSKIYWPGSELARQDDLRWPFSVRVLALVHWAMSLSMQEAGPLVSQWQPGAKRWDSQCQVLEPTVLEVSFPQWTWPLIKFQRRETHPAIVVTILVRA